MTLIGVWTVYSEGRNLKGLALEEDRHRAMLNSRGNNPLEEPSNLIRLSIGGKVEIGHFQSHLSVTNGSSHEETLVTGLIKNPAAVLYDGGDRLFHRISKLPCLRFVNEGNGLFPSVF